MNKNEQFSSERLLFRGICETDTDYLVKWRSDDNIIRYFRQPVKTTREKHIQWYEQSYIHNLERYDFIIIEKNADQPIGTVGVNHVNRGNASCEISYMIAETGYCRRGYAVEAINAMMKRMLSEHIVHFYAEIHEDNAASIRTVCKLGYALRESRAPFLVYHQQLNLER